MRVAIWWEQTSWGGVDTHLLTLLRNWPDKSDHFIVFHNSQNQGAIRLSKELAALDQVTLVSFPEPGAYLPGWIARVLHHLFLPFRFFLMKWRAQTWIARHGRFDALIANNGAYPGAWGCLAALWAGAASGIGTRVLLVHHAATARNSLRERFEFLLDRGVQRWATDLVAVSRATRATLIERRGFCTEANPIRVIHNGVDQPEESEVAGIDLRKHFDIPADAFVIGMVGRLERYKGQEDLILGIGELPVGKRTRVFAVLVGGGDDTEQERLRGIAQKLDVELQIKFAGYVDGSIAALMRQFDLLAMLTKDFEGFGLTIAEAMWVGTPVLATMVGAIPEFVSTDIATLVHPEAPSEIAEALIYVMENRDDARQRAAKAHTHIEKFSGRVMAKNFHRLLTISRA